MAEHPLLPMRNSLYRSQVIGKSSGGVARYSAVTFKLYWDSATGDPGEDIDFDVQMFEVDSSLNAVRNVIDINKEDVSSAAGNGLIHSASVNLNDVTTTDYIIKGSYGPSTPSEESLHTITWSYFDVGNGYQASQAPNLAAFSSSNEVNIVTQANQSLTGKTGFTPDIDGRYDDVMVASSGHGMKVRPGNLTDAIWVILNLS